MREGGSWAMGGRVGVGVSVGVGRGVFSGGFAVGVVVGAGVVVLLASGNTGSRSGAGPVAGEIRIGSGVGIGVFVGAALVGSVAVGCAASGSGPVSVGRMGAVMASTTAPSSLMTGGGGALRRVQMPHPKPVRMSTQPKISMPRERAGIRFFISSNRIPTERMDMPRDRAGGIFCTSSNPIQNASPCQVKLDYGIIQSQSNSTLEVNPCLL